MNASVTEPITISISTDFIRLDFVHELEDDPIRPGRKRLVTSVRIFDFEQIRAVPVCEEVVAYHSKDRFDIGLARFLALRKALVRLGGKQNRTLRKLAGMLFETSFPNVHPGKGSKTKDE